MVQLLKTEFVIKLQKCVYETDSWLFIFLSCCCKHRDKTRVQIPAKIFPHLKVKCWLFMGPTLGFDTEKRNSFLIEFGVFYI